mmetsp:Transcript_38190/g.38876  ORF Transcript_38190/g.38876 Transcript_38190/m.38876 type:complete len:363 (-) Transcript_38190:102-1190(-)
MIKEYTTLLLVISFFHLNSARLLKLPVSMKQSIVNTFTNYPYIFLSSVLTTIQDKQKCNYEGIFFGGYLIDPSQYSQFLSSLNLTRIIIITSLSNGNDIIKDANKVISIVLQKQNEIKVTNSRRLQRGDGVDNSNLMLIGHSRGGAVMAMAAAELARREVMLPTVLIDPVDTSDYITLSSLQNITHIHPVDNNYTTNNTNYDIDNNEDHINTSSHSDTGVVLPITLLISTPWGGRSRFYGVNYDSACAPTNRNAHAFYPFYKHIIYAICPQLGHTQLVNNRKNDSVASVCAGDNISDVIARNVLVSMINNCIPWLFVYRAYYRNYDKRNTDLLPVFTVLEKQLKEMYPTIIVEWRYMQMQLK